MSVNSNAQSLSAILKQRYSQQAIQSLAYQQTALDQLQTTMDMYCTDQNHVHPGNALVVHKKDCSHIDCIAWFIHDE